VTLERARELALLVERIPPDRRTELEDAVVLLATAYRDVVAYAGVEAWPE